MKEYPIGDTTPGVVPWPKPIDSTGMYGIAGEFVDLVTPHTEADPNAILLGFLTFAGNILGRNFYVMAGADQHFGNLFTCLVGNTGHGRKGSAISVVESFFRKGPCPPQLGHVLKGISTGEGLVYEVHDDIYKTTLDKKTGKYERMLAEPNEPEKRLLIVLAEFQQCLANMRRPESILASILRSAWDRGDLSTPAKNSRAVATGATISITAAMSREELVKQTDDIDIESGMLNRFNFVCSRRSKLLPQGGQFAKLFRSEAWEHLQKQLTRNIQLPPGDTAAIHMERDLDAETEWGLNDMPERGMYKALNQPRVGLWGAVTARAPQIVLRLALITSAINGQRLIRNEHLLAANEIWRYCDDSTKYVFGDKMDDPTAADIMNALRTVAPAGLSRTQIHRIWSKHRNRTDIDRALLWISHSGIARCEKIDTGGRPSETWYAI